MLATRVKTTSDLMSIALQAEREAIRRYSQLAASMHEGNNESAAALFKRLVTEEQEHERLLLEWMAQEGIDENLEIDPISWRDPNVSTTYDEEARDPYTSSPYRALAFAVHNEEIAFRFYTQVAADSENTVVREYAEVLAREELGHAALLRAERRRAYHAERETNIIEPIYDPHTIHNEIDLLAAAIHIDRYLVNEMNMIAQDNAEIKKLAQETQQQISNNENKLKSLSHNDKTAAGEEISKTLEQIDLYRAFLKKNASTPDASLQMLYACCDRSFAFYDAIVETTTDETVMLAAQKLTSITLDRIAILKQVLGSSCLSEEANKKKTTA